MHQASVISALTPRRLLSLLLIASLVMGSGAFLQVQKVLAHTSMITIHKVSPTGAPLGGAVFLIEPNPYFCEADPPVEPWQPLYLPALYPLEISDNQEEIIMEGVNEDGDHRTLNLTAYNPGARDNNPADGVIKLNNVCEPDPGEDPIEYTIFELVPPVGFELDPAPKTVIVGGPASAASATFVNQPGDNGDNGEGEGCTPGYWKQYHHLKNWVGFKPFDEFEEVFDVEAILLSDKKLLQVLWMGGGGETAMGRHAVAALLNASNPDVDFEFTVDEVIEIVQMAYSSGDFEEAKDLLEEQNELSCDLGNGKDHNKYFKLKKFKDKLKDFKDKHKEYKKKLKGHDKGKYEKKEHKVKDLIKKHQDKKKHDNNKKDKDDKDDKEDKEKKVKEIKNKILNLFKGWGRR